MKIPDYLNSKIGDVYLQQLRGAKGNEARAASEPQKTKKDELILSSLATEIRDVTEKAKDIPEVRQGKIDAIKEQVEARTYNVDGKLVAKSITDLLG